MMKEPKEASAPVDAERVVHELLDALETLAKKRRVTSSSAAEQPEPIPAYESAGGSESSGFDAQSSEDGVIQGFCRAHGVVERLRVTPQELQALADASLLGSLTCKEDVLFMLRQIRGARTNAEPEETTAPEQIRARHLFGESEANDRLLDDEPDKTQEFDSARANLSGRLVPLTYQRERHEYRASNLHWNTIEMRTAAFAPVVFHWRLLARYSCLSR